jgi:hypothetical protein
MNKTQKKLVTVKKSRQRISNCLNEQLFFHMNILVQTLIKKRVLNSCHYRVTDWEAETVIRHCCSCRSWSCNSCAVKSLVGLSMNSIKWFRLKCTFEDSFDVWGGMFWGVKGPGWSRWWIRVDFERFESRDTKDCGDSRNLTRMDCDSLESLSKRDALDKMLRLRDFFWEMMKLESLIRFCSAF